MKILFDECVPWPINKLLAGHWCSSVQAEGWSGIRNSDLLKRAEVNFDLLITADQNILYQQNLSDSKISILELSTNDLRSLLASSALIQKTVKEIRLGEFVRLAIPASN